MFNELISYLFSHKDLLFKMQFFSCAFMTGLIWVIQILHYPSFAFVAKDKFLKFHHIHTTRITFIVAPVMILELMTAAFLCLPVFLGIQNIEDVFSKIIVLNFVLVIAIWLATFFVSVPLHNQLLSGQNTDIINKLVKTNWIRTFLYSLRIVIMLFM